MTTSTQEFLTDTADARRGLADAQAAEAAGFELPKTIYQPGLQVIDLGVANYRESRKRFEETPHLHDVARGLRETVAAERRADDLVEVRHLVADAACVLHRSREPFAHGDAGFQARVASTPDGDEASWQAGPDAVAEVMGRLLGESRTGATYVARCFGDLKAPQLGAENLNYWLSHRDLYATGKPRVLKLRTRRKARGEGREVFGVVGPNYASFDGDAVATLVAETLAGLGARGQVSYDRASTRMRLEAFWHSNLDLGVETPVVGEVFQVGVRVRSVDDGSGAIHVDVVLLRNLCLNMLIIGSAVVDVGKVSHVGEVSRLRKELEKAVTRSRDALQHFIGAWGPANLEESLAGIDEYGIHDAESLLERLALNRVVRADGVEPEDMAARLVAAFRREPAYTKAGVINAITRAAHEEEWGSWSTSDDLERVAGELLFQPVTVWNIESDEDLAA